MINTLNKHFIDNNNQVIAGKVGAIPAIVKAINTHIDNVYLCNMGCAALLDITLNSKKNNEYDK